MTDPCVPDTDRLLGLYRTMCRIRAFEDAAEEASRGGVTAFGQAGSGRAQVRGPLHLSTGQEAVAAGVCAHLRSDDWLTSTHRGHGHTIAKGANLERMMHELFGRASGFCGGKGGSMHIASKEHRMWGGYAIVGGHLPLAAGIAFASKYKDTDEVTICFIGDGASNNGYFHEAVNISGAWKLPIVWIIENNLVAMGTRVEDSTAQPLLHLRAEGYGIKDGGRIDGQDVMAVHDAVSDAVAYARKNGPVLIESLTYRYKGHGVSDKSYDKRFADELEEWKQNRDPITLFERVLEGKYKNIGPELKRIHDACAQAVDESVEFALNSPEPTYDDLIRNVYVD